MNTFLDAKSVRRIVAFSATLLAVAACEQRPVPIERDRSLPAALYDLNSNLETRSISFENPTGDRGAGGKATSPLGVGRKGAPARTLGPGKEVQLADLEGTGTIRHVWMTTFPNPSVLRGAVIRVYWDGQEHPSIEAPLGDFFGFAHGMSPAFQTAVHSVGEAVGMNIWLPMPFVTGVRITLTNDTPIVMPLFYQIDYPLGDAHPDDVGRLHVCFQRQNPTTAGRDFEILPARMGKGRFIGTVIGVRPLGPDWWGEGEFKFYRDGDTTFPTIAGTGAEDYVGLSWGLQPTAFLYQGATYREKGDRSDTGRISMYRWHLLDPVLWDSRGRATIQQIGHKPNPQEGRPTTLDAYLGNLFEREDDWSAASFWYEAIPSAALPELPDYAARIADLESE